MLLKNKKALKSRAKRKNKRLAKKAIAGTAKSRRRKIDNSTVDKMKQLFGGETSVKRA